MGKSTVTYTASNLPLNLSPKVAAFVAAIGGPGVLILILGLAVGDETLKTIGLTLLGGGVVGGGVGYKAPAGDTVRLSDEEADLHDAVGA